MRKYKAGSYKQAAAIARRSTGWDDLERFVLKDIAEGRLFSGGDARLAVFWCDVRKVGFVFNQVKDSYEIARIYTK